MTACATVADLRAITAFPARMSVAAISRALGIDPVRARVVRECATRTPPLPVLQVMRECGVNEAEALAWLEMRHVEPSA